VCTAAASMSDASNALFNLVFSAAISVLKDEKVSGLPPTCTDVLITRVAGVDDTCCVFIIFFRRRFSWFRFGSGSVQS
jgi:hypothetical protein